MSSISFNVNIVRYPSGIVFNRSITIGNTFPSNPDQTSSLSSARTGSAEAKASSIFTKRFSRRRKSIDLFMQIRRSHAHSSSGLLPPVRNRINVSCMISSASLDDNVMRKAVLYSLLPYCRNSSVAFLSSMPISFSPLALQIYQIFYTLDGQWSDLLHIVSKKISPVHFRAGLNLSICVSKCYSAGVVTDCLKRPVMALPFFTPNATMTYSVLGLNASRVML